MPIEVKQAAVQSDLSARSLNIICFGILSNCFNKISFMKLKGPHVKASLRDHFSVEASNLISHIKHLAVKTGFDFKCRIKS